MPSWQAVQGGGCILFHVCVCVCRSGPCVCGDSLYDNNQSSYWDEHTQKEKGLVRKPWQGTHYSPLYPPSAALPLLSSLFPLLLPLPPFFPPFFLLSSPSSSSLLSTTLSTSQHIYFLTIFICRHFKDSTKQSCKLFLDISNLTVSIFLTCTTYLVCS